MRVGITGQSGFIGAHLASAIAEAEDMDLVPFEDSFFENDVKLRSFVRQCDAIVHLAAISRAQTEDEVYRTNMGLVDKLIHAMELENVAPHVLFSSSTHETRDTAYGRAKRDGRKRFSEWAEESGAAFTGFIFPNVYGPGARVFYASFIANFAWQLNHGEEPTILVDAPIRLIYVKNLVEMIKGRIRNVANADSSDYKTIARIEIPWDFEKNVSEILSIFRAFQSSPPAPDADDNMRNLYQTFLSYME